MTKANPSRAAWLAKAAASGWRCSACGLHRPLSAHHILPRARGGGDEIGNLAVLCNACHAAAHAGRLPDWIKSRRG